MTLFCFDNRNMTGEFQLQYLNFEYICMANCWPKVYIYLLVIISFQKHTLDSSSAINLPCLLLYILNPLSPIDSECIQERLFVINCLMKRTIVNSA